MAPRTKCPRASFTLIELLIVIAVVAILSVVVVLVLNPVQLLKQARDGNRLSDLDTLNRALNLFRGDQTNASLGNTSTTYLSVVDTTATTTAGTNCAGSALIAPSNWNYHCAASSTQKNIDGTGWLPMNFKNVSYGSPIGSLPADPANSAGAGLYYMYTPGISTWALASMLESDKYLAAKSGSDGGYDPGRYEIGSDLSLVAKGEGLAAWWPLDETAGTTSADSSGNGNAGTLSGGVTVGQAGKVGKAMAFNGTDGMITYPSFTLASHSLSMWYNPNTIPGTNLRMLGMFGATVTKLQLQAGVPYFYAGTGGINGSAALSTGQWYNLVGTYDGANLNVYVNGSLVGAVGGATGSPTASAMLLSGGNGTFFNGTADEVRVYNRVLTAAEVAAMYNAQK